MIRTRPRESWETFAANEPYFAVLAEPKYLRANLDPAAEADFFRTGEKLIEQTFEVIRARISPAFEPKRALELGCGAGRLLAPIAKRVGEVTAVDLSPTMLRAAKENAARLGATNVRFQTLETFLETPATFDLIMAYLVFQHVPRTEGLELLREILGRLDQFGVGMLQFPYRHSTSSLFTALRWLRSHLPDFRGVRNFFRGRPFDLPVRFPTTYDINEVFSIVQRAGCPEPHVVFTDSGDLEVIIIYVEKKTLTPDILQHPHPRPLSQGERGTATNAFIDVRAMIGQRPIEELNQKAEEYFAGLENWDYHLAKPFANIEDTPALLINVATLLQGLELAPGMTVLEFGAGSGWLSRWLTQLGCRAVLLEPSSTALKIARELYERHPVIGERPAPVFLPFDGRHIDLPDGSVDRIVTFDAFHHAPNPEDVLREFSRVLVAGGIAAFAEPGPHHSKTPQSQFEMRSYGVVENDVDIRTIWRSAQAAGFADLRLAAFHGRPFHVSMGEYEDLLAGGETAARWTRASREFLGATRDFFLVKAGERATDSRRAEALASVITAELRDETLANRPALVHATVRNTGRGVWLPSDASPGGVSLGCHLYDEAGTLLDFNFHWQKLSEPSRAIEPGETVILEFHLPPLAAGTYQLELDLVALHVAWFAQAGSRPARLTLRVAPDS